MIVRRPVTRKSRPRRRAPRCMPSLALLAVAAIVVGALELGGGSKRQGQRRTPPAAGTPITLHATGDYDPSGDRPRRARRRLRVPRPTASASTYWKTRALRDTGLRRPQVGARSRARRRPRGQGVEHHGDERHARLHGPDPRGRLAAGASPCGLGRENGRRAHDVRTPRCDGALLLLWITQLPQAELTVHVNDARPRRSVQRDEVKAQG